MASTTGDILQDMVAALRTAGGFALVTLGPAGTSTAVPRAAVLYEGTEEFPSDDRPAARWLRIRAAVSVHTRSDDPAEGCARASELCQAASEALMADPYRNGKCSDLPVGRATELGHWQLDESLKRPEVEISFAVRCHLEMAEES